LGTVNHRKALRNFCAELRRDLKMIKSYAADRRMGPVNWQRLYEYGTPIQRLYIIAMEVSKMSQNELFFEVTV